MSSQGEVSVPRHVCLTLDSVLVPGLQRPSLKAVVFCSEASQHLSITSLSNNS